MAVFLIVFRVRVGMIANATRALARVVGKRGTGRNRVTCAARTIIPTHGEESWYETSWS